MASADQYQNLEGIICSVAHVESKLRQGTYFVQDAVKRLMILVIYP